MEEKLDIIAIGESLIELSSDKKLCFAETLTKYYGKRKETIMGMNQTMMN